MRLLVAFIVVVSGFFTQAHAWPSVSITTVEMNGYELTVSSTLSGWSLTDNTLTECGHSRVVCEMTFSYFSPDGQPHFLERFEIDARKYPDAMTMGQVLKEFNDKGMLRMPHVRVNRFYLFPVSDVSCIAYTLNGNPSQRTNCARVLVPAQCDFGGNAVIDHKALSDNSLDGAQASTQLDLKCARDASVLIKVSRTNSYGVRLRNDDSLYSEVRVNGKDATEGFDLEVRSNVNTSLTITSTLRTRGYVAPGAFSGFTVVTVSPN